jgi:hypothetical protein
MYFKLKQIGLIKRPYTVNAPYQPVDDNRENFLIIVTVNMPGDFFILSMIIL